MDHNQQLINIINELNANEQNTKTDKTNLQAKSNSVKNIVEDLPETTDILKSYIEKFNKFKANLEKSHNNSNSLMESVLELDKDIHAPDEYERYSRSDSRVFKNKAKKNEVRIDNSRLKKYSNSRANLTSDQRMSPLRLSKYSS